ncbi:MAG: hypothetical protein ACD_23C00347G0002 [uncultured bacterium]|nr:MAG: hypothetical protein ACD_23C00347G0002 [uncultured bacterium]
MSNWNGGNASPKNFLGKRSKDQAQREHCRGHGIEHNVEAWQCEKDQHDDYQLWNRAEKIDTKNQQPIDGFDFIGADNGKHQTERNADQNGKNRHLERHQKSL